jgi:2-C-methyl-D-erythritol 4-phosphate cytidylyltransferase
MPEEIVIIVAGGTGSRMKSDKPKQFIELHGLPVIIHTLRKFLDYQEGIQIIIVVHRDFQAYLKELLKQHQLPQSILVTEGGDTRFDSVYQGLKMIKDEQSLVAIHDAARPLVSVDTIRSCFTTARIKGNAVPCVPVSDSLRNGTAANNRAVNREEYWSVQTPQCFQTAKLRQAFLQGYQPSFTDDATVLESLGEKINLVEGNPENIKITGPHDLLLAAALMTPFH